MKELTLQRYLAATQVHLFTPTWSTDTNPQSWLSVDSGKYTATLASSRDDVRQAQQLRFKVFVEEYGAVFQTAAARIDEDEFDEYCDHLIVRDKDSGEVVGTYRVLLPELAKRIGGYYSGKEFFITRIGRLVPDLAELGRSCVHPDHRTGGVILLLWTAIARYLERHSCRYLMGCVSVSMRDGGALAASLWDRYKKSHRIDDMLEAFPLFEAGVPIGGGQGFDLHPHRGDLAGAADQRPNKAPQGRDHGQADRHPAGGVGRPFRRTPEHQPFWLLCSQNTSRKA